MKNISLNIVKKDTPQSKRYIELDILRGLAIILMIFGHILWDLDYFKIIPINHGIYKTLQPIIPTLFFIIVGLSVIVGRMKREMTAEQEKNYQIKLIKRGLKIFNLGMVLTIGSIIFIPDRPVIFGVLHCIGLSIVLSALFVKTKKYNIIFSTIFIVLGYFLMYTYFTNPSILQIILGMHSEYFWMQTVDYFPMLPWLGVMLLGMSIGYYIFDLKKRNLIKIKMPDLSVYKPARFFSYIGRYSLEIYLVHQPIIAGSLLLYINYLKVI